MESTIAGREHPAHMGSALARAIGLGDLGAASRCFFRDGCLITPDATAIHGRDRIRPVLAQLTARRTEIEVEASNVVNAGGAVLAYESWKVHSGGIDSPQVTQIWRPTLVLRQRGGDWGVAIAAPWGWGPAHV